MLETPENEYQKEDVLDAEKRLRALLEKRDQLTKNLLSIENSLYNLETAYIEDTTYGNIIRGYDGFLNNRTPISRRQRPMESERIFSQSSSMPGQKQELMQVDPLAEFHDGFSDKDEEFTIEKKRKKKTDSSVRKKNVVMSDDD